MWGKALDMLIRLTGSTFEYTEVSCHWDVCLAIAHPIITTLVSLFVKYFPPSGSKSRPSLQSFTAVKVLVLEKVFEADLNTSHCDLQYCFYAKSRFDTLALWVISISKSVLKNKIGKKASKVQFVAVRVICQHWNVVWKLVKRQLSGLLQVSFRFCTSSVWKR